MPGKKDFLAQCLAKGGITRLVSHVRSLLAGDLLILAYHRVWDISDENRFPYDVELVSASLADFGWQMQYLQANFTPITFEKLSRILDGLDDCPTRPVIVTFDDGYEDNYEEAFPILNAFGIPATMFLSTDYIGTEKTFWYDHLTHLLLTTERHSTFVASLGTNLELGEVRSRREAVRRLLTQLKRMPNDRRLAVLDELDTSLGGDAEHSAAVESCPMSWEQVREMSSAGIEFGSHTATHPILANVDDATLRRELEESKRTIESHTGKPIAAISYPVGGTTAIDDRVFAAVQRAGYRFGATYLPGTNSIGKLDEVTLRRLHVERYTSRASFAAMLNMPAMFGS